LLSGGRRTLAARVSAHPPVQALCLQVGSALVSTSANRSGELPAENYDELCERLDVEACLDAPLGTLNGPTPIYDVRDGSVLRN